MSKKYISMIQHHREKQNTITGGNTEMNKEQAEYYLPDLLDDARDSLKNDYNLLDEQYPSDIVSEIADSFVPVYTFNLIEYGYHNRDLMFDEPELGPAFDGSPTPTNIIAANIYEAVYNHLYQELDSVLTELEEEA